MRRSSLPVLTAIFVAALLSLATPQATTSQTATPQYPNLKTSPPYELRFDQVTINGTSQHVLRFSNRVWNAGTGPLHLVPENDRTTAKTKVYQEIYSTTTASGTPVERRLAGEAEFHPAHNHWHFQDFAKYELYTKAEWEGARGNKRGEGTKTTFCIIDTQRMSGTLPARYTTCGQTDVTGLSVGWGDVYGYQLADQWVLLGSSSLTDGEYVLRSWADPLNKLKEGPTNSANESIDDNQAVTSFSVCSGAISLSGCATSGAPANDNRAAAATLSVPGSASAQTQSATLESGEPRPCGSIDKTVWYKLVPGSSGTLTAETAGSSFDTVLALYSGSSTTALACNDDVSSSDRSSRVSASVTAGQTYYLQAGGYNAAGGSLALAVSLQATSTPTPTPTTTTATSTPTSTSTPTGTVMHVGDLDGSGVSGSGSNWQARVTITVHDAQHNAVDSAAVSGNWSSGYSGSASCTTNSAGQCSVTTGNVNKRTSSVTFTVSNVTRSGRTYQSSSNHDPDGNSTGTRITVSSP